MSLRGRVRRLAEMLGVVRAVPRESTVVVGGASLVIETSSPLRAILSDDPGYNSVIARLVALVVGKYPDASMLDIGANIGDTVAVARSAAALPIVCFEGDPAVFDLLSRNIRQFPGVAAHRVYLGERTETIDVAVAKAGWNATLVPGRGGRPLQLTAFDDFLADHPLPARPKLIKVDAEGFDARILRGAARFLADRRPVTLFEYNRYNMTAIAEEGLPLFAQLREAGYDRTFFYDASGRLILITSVKDVEQVGDLHAYVDGWNAPFPYFDVCAFHAEDTDIASRFAVQERAFRSADSGEAAWLRRRAVSVRPT